MAGDFGPSASAHDGGRIMCAILDLLFCSMKIVAVYHFFFCPQMTTSGDDAPQMDCEMELGVDDALTEDQAIDDFLKQHAPQMECEMGLGLMMPRRRIKLLMIF